MRVAANDYMRKHGVIPAGWYLKLDSFGTNRTRERKRPARLNAVPVQKRNAQKQQ